MIGAAFALTLLGACSSDEPAAPETTGAADTTEAETTVAETDSPTTEAADTTVPEETDSPTTEAADTTVPEELDSPTTESAETTEVPETTDAPSTTEEETTTTAASTPGGAIGLMWESGIDPSRVNATEGQPIIDSEGVHVSVDAFLFAPLDTETCQQIAADMKSYGQQVPTTGCLIVQYRFDVADTIPTEYSEEANISFADAVTAEGRQVQGFGDTYQSAFKGTVDNVGVVAYPDAGPGSTLRFDTVDGAYNSTTHTLVVPTLLPLAWDIDE